MPAVVETPSTATCGQRPVHPAQRLGPIAAPADQLGDHRVVVRHDRPAVEAVRVDAHARALGHRPALDPAGRGQEARRGVLGVEPALDRVPVSRTSSWVTESGSPGGDAQLLADDVDAGDHLGDGVLDLHPRVDLEEREVAAVDVHEELDRARADVLHAVASAGGRGADRRRAGSRAARSRAPPRRSSGTAAAPSSPARRGGSPSRACRPAPAPRRGGRCRSSARRTGCRRRTRPRPHARPREGGARAPPRRRPGPCRGRPRPPTP